MIYSFCFYNSIACFIASLLFFFYKTRILNTAGKLASNERMNYESVASVPVLYRRVYSSSVLGLKFWQSLMTRKPVLLLNLFRKWTIEKRNRVWKLNWPDFNCILWRLMNLKFVTLERGFLELLPWPLFPSPFLPCLPGRWTTPPKKSSLNNIGREKGRYQRYVTQVRCLTVVHMATINRILKLRNR